MNIELDLNDETRRFLEELKLESDALIVPREKWTLYVQDNPKILPVDMPKHMFSGDFVITERTYFNDLIRGLGSLFHSPVRLHKGDGGFWFSKTLEPKKNLPKKDIFDVGHRQGGSFGSNGNY